MERISQWCDKLYRNGGFKNFGFLNTNTNETLAFVVKENHIQKAIDNSNITTVIYNEKINIKKYSIGNMNFFPSSDPNYDYWYLFNKMAVKGFIGVNVKGNIHETSNIHPTAIISSNSEIQKNAVVRERAVVLENSIIGEGAEIGPGAIVGADGLQVVISACGSREPICVKHAGGVSIGKGSKLLANSVVAKSVFPGNTTIGDGSYIGISTTVGHQAQIGSGCRISSNVVVGGSSQIGDNVWIGPSATISSAIRIGNNAQVKIGSVVIQSVKDGTVVSGNFAYNHSANLKRYMKNKGSY